jgi:hypothetical protein
MSRARLLISILFFSRADWRAKVFRPPFIQLVNVVLFGPQQGQANPFIGNYALRVAGNLGTHNNTITRTEMLDAFEIYEHALSELIDKKSAQIDKLAKQMATKLGKASKKSSKLPF